MKKRNVDDYLQEGIYGTPETKPSERKQYLGTIRERVILVLTKGQVMQGTAKKELSSRMKQYKDATLLLNGEVSYRFLSPYMDIAEEESIHHTMVSNQEADTDTGLVLTVDYPVELEDVTVNPSVTGVEEKSVQRGWKGWMRSLFKPKE